MKTISRNHLKSFRLYPLFGYISILSFGGCAVGPQRSVPEITPPAGFKNEIAQGVPTAGTLPDVRWWRVYGDGVLDVLVERAMAESPDVTAAFARVERSAAIAGLAQSALFPSLDFVGSANRQRSSGNTGKTSTPASMSNRFSNALGLDWEVDMWGRVHRLQESADASALAEARAYDYVVLTLRAKVVEAYFNIRVLDRSVEILRKTVEFRKTAQKLVRLRNVSGLADEFEAAQTDTELAGTLAELKSYERKRALAENALAILVGAYPAEFALAVDATWQPPSLKIPQALPSELLQRRPDIIEAELLVRAASAKIGASYAAYYPKITLTGDVGFTAGKLSNLYEQNSLFGSMGPAVTWNVFNSGYTESQVAQSEAEYRQLVALYRKQVLTAFGEVEDALASLSYLQAELAARKDASVSAERASTLARERHKNGLVSTLELMDSERAALNTALAWTQTMGVQLTQSVELTRALGGGWEEKRVGEKEWE